MKTMPLLHLLTCLLLAVGCSSGPSVQRVSNPVVAQQTVEGIGACQGVMVLDGSVWLYGDRGKGIVRRLEWAGVDANGKPSLRDSRENYELMLYRNLFAKNDQETKLSSNLIPHPTGLTFNRELGTFIGNTVNQKGTIYHFFWEGFTESGNLDDWVYNVTSDDLAVNGTRPEFVRFNGQWFIATADYGDKANQLRLYDPEKLAKAKRTSDPGVRVAAFDCGPFVQSLHWIDAENTLVLVQNQTAGLGYRLTLMKFGEDQSAPVVERVIDMGQPTDELEGFAIVAPGWAVLTSSSAEQNVSIIRWPIEAR